MATNIKLHVVFAGRGDAFILDYTYGGARRLVLVDGGPRTLKAIDGFWVRDRPYYKHFISAIREIWGLQNTQPMSLKVVNSHSDDDHRYGLLRFVREIDPNGMNWDEFEFYTPFLRKESADADANTLESFTDIIHQLQERQLRPQLAPNGELPWGLRQYYPNSQWNIVLRFKRNADYIANLEDVVDLNGYDTPLKRTVTNQSSILMATGPRSSEPIFFTGDSSVGRISPFLSNCNTHLSIYKIQHHGAYEDNMCNHDDLRVALEVTDETFVFILLRKALGGSWPRYWDGRHKDKTGAGDYSIIGVTKLLGWIREETKSALQTTDEKALNDYLTMLDGRQKKMATAAFRGLAGNRLSYDALRARNVVEPWPNNTVDPAVIFNAVYHWTRLPNEWEWFWTRDPGEYTRRHYQNMHPWFRFLLVQEGCQRFLVAFGIGQVYRFYTTFTADAYVVSGTRFPYDHPNVYVLVGLAYAVLRMDRRAALYMTDASVMNDKQFSLHCNLVGCTPEQLFAGQNLRAYYFDERSYITLDGNKDPGPARARDNTVLAKWQRERGGYVSQVDFDNDDLARREYVRNAFTDDNKLLNSTDTTRRRWTIYTNIGNALRYLRYDQNIRVSALLGPPLVNNPIIPYFLLKETVVTHEHGYGRKLWVYDPDGGMSNFVFYSRASGVGPDLWELAWRTSTQEIRVLAYDPTRNQVVLVAQDTLLQICPFTFAPHVWPAPVVNNRQPNALQMTRVQQPQPNYMIRILEEESNIVTTVMEDLKLSADTTVVAVSSSDEDSSLISAAVASQDVAFEESAPAETAVEEDVTSDTLIETPALEGDESKFPSITSDVPPDPLTDGESMNQYLIRIGFDPSTISSRRQALDAITGRQRNLSSKLTLGYDKLLLDRGINLETSKVKFSLNNAAVDQMSASLKAVAEPSDEIAFGSNKLQIKSSDITITCTDKKLQVDSQITTSDELSLTTSRSLELAAQFANLRDYLLQAGIKPEVFSKITLTDLLPLLLQGDTQKAIDLICQHVPSKLLEAGLAKLQPDLDNSPLESSRAVTSNPSVKKATIHLQLDGINKFVKALTFNAINVEVSRLSLGLVDIGTPEEQVSIQGAATIAAEDKTIVQLEIDCALTDQESDLTFTATDLTSIGNIAKSLAIPYDNMKSLEVPMSKKNDQEPQKSLEVLAASQVGFSIRQKLKISKDYTLAAVFIAVKIDDWKAYLPEAFKLDGIDEPKVRITVLNPTMDYRRIRTEVYFSVPLDKSAASQPGPKTALVKKHLKVNFIADPIGYDKDYTLRIGLTCHGGLTLADIASKMGLDISSSLMSNIPILEPIMTKIAVDKIDAAVEKVDNKFTFTDWSFTLLFSNLSLIPNQFILRQARITVEKLSQESIASAGSGELYITSLDRNLEVTFRTPRAGDPGFINVKAPARISAQTILEKLGVTGLKDVPVVGTILSTAVKSIHLCLGYPPEPAEKKNSLSCFGAGVDFSLEEPLKIGPMTLEELDVSLSWYGKHDPRALKKDRKAFAISSLVFNRSLRAQVSYDTQNHLICALLRPVDDVTLAGLVHRILPDNLKTAELLPAVTDMSLMQAGLAFDTGENNEVDRFDLDLMRNEELHVAGNKSFVLEEVMVSYRRGKKVEDKEAPKDTSNISTGENKITSAELEPSTGAQKASSNKTKSAPELTEIAKSPNGARPDTSTVESSFLNPSGNEVSSPWPEEADYPQYNTLIVSGTARINDLRARLSFKYQSGDPKTANIVSLSVVGLDKNALALTNFLKLFGLLDNLSYEKPYDCPSFPDFEITRLSGSVEIGPASDLNPDTQHKQGSESKPSAGGGSSSSVDNDDKDIGLLPMKPEESKAPPKRKFILATADLTVQTTKSITILDSPSVVVQYFGLDLSYKAKAVETTDQVGLTATVYGQVDIAGHPMRILFRKDKKRGAVFVGEMTFGGDKDVQFADLTKQYLGNAKFEFPKDVQLPSKIAIGRVSVVYAQKKFLQVSAYGENICSIPIEGTDVTLKVDKLGGFLQATQYDAGKYEYNVHLFGQISFKNDYGFTQATATLDIGHNTDSVLAATLSTKPGQAASVSDLASALSTDTKHNWGEIAPKTKPLKFAGSTTLYINFTRSQFVIAGEIAGIGSAVLMGRKHPTEDKRGYFFSLVAVKVEQVWSDLEEAVSKTFSIERMAIQVLTYETRPKDLKDDLDLAVQGSIRSQTRQDLAKNASGQIEEEKADTSNQGEASKPSAEDSEAVKKKLKQLSEVPDIQSIQKQDKLLPGAWFFAEISLDGQQEMSSALALAAEGNQSKRPGPPKIILYACVGDPATTQYSIDVQKLILLGGAMEINASGSYIPGGKREGSDVVERHIDITGDLTLSQLRTPIKFKVDYHARPKRTWFALSAETLPSTSIEEPMKDMFNVTLKELAIKGEINERRETTYEVYGKVQLGPGNNVEHALTGRIIFHKNTPRAVFLEYENEPDTTLPVSNVYDKVLKPGNLDNQVSWPADHPDFKFISALIYYINGTGKFEYLSKQYEPGYGLRASVYLFGKPFSVGVDVAAARKGIYISAIHEATIDLEFAELSGYKGNAAEAENGPALTIDARDSKKVYIGAKAAVSFFKQKPLDVTFGYDTGEKGFTGSIQFREDFMGIPTPKIEFLYKNGRFSFKRWEIHDELSKYIGVMDILKKGASADKPDCGELVNIVFKKTVVTRFKFDLALPADGESTEDPKAKEGIVGKHKSVVKDGVIKLDLKWSYEMAAFGELPMFDLKMPDLPLEISPRLDKDGVIATLGKFIQKNLESISKKLVEHPENLIELVGAMALKECGKWAIKSLLCHGADNEDLVKEGQERAKKDAEDSKKKSDKSGDSAKNTSGGSGGTGGTGGARGAAGGIGGALFGLGIGLAIGLGAWLIGKLVGERSKNDKTKKDMKDLKDELDVKHRENLKKIKAALLAVRQSMVLKGPPTVSFKSGKPEDVSVVCNWADVVPTSLDTANGIHADMRWKLTYSTKEDMSNSTEVLDIAATNYTIQYPRLGYERILYVQVKAYMPIEDEWFKPPKDVPEPTDLVIKKYLEDEWPNLKQDVFGDSKFVEATDWSKPGWGD